MQKPLARKLKALFDVRNTLIGYDALNDVIVKALEISRERLHSQTAAVFLFSKTGSLERIAIRGVDKYGSTILNDWYPHEEHNIGESFTGKVALPSKNSNFGEPYCSNNLANEDIDSNSRTAYLEKLGALSCAIAVPLNGRHRTYGALEVINKLDKNGVVNAELGFSQDDIYWLSSIGLSLGTAISDLRRRNELAMLSEISKLLVEPFSNTFDSKSIYDQIASKLVGPLLSYNACIIRIGKTSETLETVARTGDGISWQQRVDEPIAKGERLGGKVYASGKYEVIEEIEYRKHEFRNLNWINANRLKSYACLPLLVKDTAVGTLSIFTGYVHRFYPNDIRFLENIASLIATFTESSRVISELHARSLERDKYLSEVRGMSYDLSVHSLLHDQKHEYQGLLVELEKAEEGSPGLRTKVIRQLIGELKGEIAKATRRMQEISGETSEEAVDINEIIRNIVKSFNTELRGAEIPIRILPKLSPIPLISASGVEIKDLIFNLVSNAVKAIRGARRKQGEIAITTDIVEVDISYIQITVEDNGIGIRNENRNRIYERGYTTFEGGTGRGLSIARSIVNNYGGKIDFDSTVGKGTKFVVRLPKRLEV